MIPKPARRALEEVLGDRVAFEVPMSRHTSLGVGGPAEAVATPADCAELARTLRTCAAHGLAHSVIGGGFNTLVLDGGLPGVAILTRRLRKLEERPGGCVRVGAGVSHAQLSRFCCERGLGGLEFAAGIPGSVGGWVAMNAGIPRREIGAAVCQLEVISPSGRQRSQLDAAALRFGYRQLRGLAPGSVVASALLRVAICEPDAVRAEVDRLLALRADSQPLDVPSCGSVFRNPPGDFAGRLIEAVGLKGAIRGGAQISPVHANFIATRRGARAADVLALIECAARAVERHCGVRLRTEVVIVGRPG